MENYSSLGEAFICSEEYRSGMEKKGGDCEVKLKIKDFFLGGEGHLRNSISNILFVGGDYIRLPFMRETNFSFVSEFSGAGSNKVVIDNTNKLKVGQQVIVGRGGGCQVISSVSGNVLNFKGGLWNDVSVGEVIHSEDCIDTMVENIKRPIPSPDYLPYYKSNNISKNSNITIDNSISNDINTRLLEEVKNCEDWFIINGKNGILNSGCQVYFSDDTNDLEVIKDSMGLLNRFGWITDYIILNYTDAIKFQSVRGNNKFILGMIPIFTKNINPNNLIVGSFRNGMALSVDESIIIKLDRKSIEAEECIGVRVLIPEAFVHVKLSSSGK